MNELLDMREPCALCQIPIIDTNTEIYSYDDGMLCATCAEVKEQEAIEEEEYAARKAAR